MTSHNFFASLPEEHLRLSPRETSHHLRCDPVMFSVVGATCGHPACRLAALSASTATPHPAG